MLNTAQQGLCSSTLLIHTPMYCVLHECCAYTFAKPLGCLELVSTMKHGPPTATMDTPASYFVVVPHFFTLTAEARQPTASIGSTFYTRLHLMLCGQSPTPHSKLKILDRALYFFCWHIHCSYLTSMQSRQCGPVYHSRGCRTSQHPR